MIKTNEKQLVEILLQCQPGQAYGGRMPNVSSEGTAFTLPGIGGITLNIEVGNSAFGLQGDHIEPGVSCRSGDKAFENPNRGLQTYSCAGNVAKIISGAAKGKKGTVIGHHGGSEHIIVDFDRKVKEKMTYDDKIMIVSKGMGLRLTDFPTIHTVNLSPELLKKMNLKVNKKTGKLLIPVTTKVPSECMGSGIGSLDVHSGDYDIMTQCKITNKKYNLENIRLGDFVALIDQDGRYGYAHRKGAVIIGIVIHSDSFFSGHGPGVTPLFTCPEGMIEPFISSKANIADLLKIGNKRNKK